MSGTETTMTTKKRPRNSFSAALDAAGKRYAQATKEREKAVQTLDKLDKEIPALQQTIKALQAQLHPNSGTFRNSTTGKETTPAGEVRVPALPSELAKIVGPQDLSGMGSIPPSREQLTLPQTITSEDDTLPDPDGTPLTED